MAGIGRWCQQVQQNPRSSLPHITTAIPKNAELYITVCIWAGRVHSLSKISRTLVAMYHHKTYVRMQSCSSFNAYNAVRQTQEHTGDGHASKDWNLQNHVPRPDAGKRVTWMRHGTTAPHTCRCSLVKDAQRFLFNDALIS